MKARDRYCNGCHDSTEQVDVGLLPTIFTKGDQKSTWVRCTVCSKCGGINTVAPTEKDVQSANRRYSQALVNLGLETEETIENKTGLVL